MKQQFEVGHNTSSQLKNLIYSLIYWELHCASRFIHIFCVATLVFKTVPPVWYIDNIKYIILQHVVVIDMLSISSEIALKWIPQGYFEYKST